MNLAMLAKLREASASLVRDLVPHFVGKTEADLAQALRTSLSAWENIYPEGWYSPPPHGISVLAAQQHSFARLNFDSLRRQDYWPSSNQIKDDSVVVVYVSPVLKSSCLLGDWGGTIFLGDDPHISDHILRCQKIMKELALSIHPGLPFSEIHCLAQSRFKKESLNNASTVSDSDPSRTNLGHTVPFSFDYNLPSGFDSQSEDYRVRISTARRFLSATETLRVPTDGAFTFEARLIDESEVSLPNTLVHLMIIVRDGSVVIL